MTLDLPGTAPSARAAFDGLARLLAGGRDVPLDRVLVVVAGAGLTVADLEDATGRYAADPELLRLADDGCTIHE